MTINDWLSSKTKSLETSGIGTARLDCLVLLEDLVQKDRSWLLAHPEFELSVAQAKTLAKQLKRRVGHEPLAYIRGKTEFYGREFVINQGVLEPRPESETMIDMFKATEPMPGSTILDIGTGSGALAITVKLEIPHLKVIATDIDPKCLAVAQANAKKHTATVKFYHGNLLDALPSTIYPAYRQAGHLPPTILANLPYVPDDYAINQAAMNEPKTAIFGGKDGLDLYRQLFDQIKLNELNVGYVLTEALPFQHHMLAQIARQSGLRQTNFSDFIQLFST